MPVSAVHKKRMLWAICIVAVIAMIAEIIFARTLTGSASLPIWKLEMLLLPWVLFVGCYVALVCTSWFEDEQAPLLRKAMNTIGAAGVTGLVTMIYFALMFR